MQNRALNKSQRFNGLVALIVVVTGMPVHLFAGPSNVSLASSATSIEAYDFVEFTISLAKADAKNPFMDASVSGTFSAVIGGKEWRVDGFCDSSDGSIYKISVHASGARRLQVRRYISPGARREKF